MALKVQGDISFKTSFMAGKLIPHNTLNALNNTKPRANQSSS